MEIFWVFIYVVWDNLFVEFYICEGELIIYYLLKFIMLSLEDFYRCYYYYFGIVGAVVDERFVREENYYKSIKLD